MFISLELEHFDIIRHSKIYLMLGVLGRELKMLMVLCIILSSAEREYSKEKWLNTMAADASPPCVAKTSTTMI